MKKHAQISKSIQKDWKENQIIQMFQKYVFRNIPKDTNLSKSTKLL